jgi:hypothetical protein
MRPMGQESAIYDARICDGTLLVPKNEEPVTGFGEDYKPFVQAGGYSFQAALCCFAAVRACRISVRRRFATGSMDIDEHRGFLRRASGRFAGH